jgi:hypothetical protein
MIFRVAGSWRRWRWFWRRWRRGWRRSRSMAEPRVRARITPHAAQRAGAALQVVPVEKRAGAWPQAYAQEAQPRAWSLAIDAARPQDNGAVGDSVWRESRLRKASFA